MPAQLVPLGPGPSPTIPLQRPVILVGRHEECDVRIDLDSVSRRHCCLATAYDRLLIRDLGSRHGVRVNGRKVEEARLSLGDEVAIGAVLYRLEEIAATPIPPPRPPTPAPRSGELAPLDDPD